MRTRASEFINSTVCVALTFTLCGCRDQQKTQYPGRADGPQVEIVAAAEDLPAGTVIGLRSLGKIRVAGEVGDHIAPKDVQQLRGKRLARAVTFKQPLTWADIEGGDVSKSQPSAGSDSTNRAEAVRGTLQQ